MLSRSIRPTIALALLVAGASACSEDSGEGTVEVRIWGEDFVESGIPADVFVDGWSIEWNRFLVAVDGIATPEAEDPTRWLFDLTAETGGAGAMVASLASASGATELAYRVGPGRLADAGNAVVDAPMMEDDGHSIFVDGIATKDGRSIAFAWGFASDTTYHACEVVEEVPDGGQIRTVVTIHADHLFYDDLEAPEPDVTFDLVASADVDGDGTVTREELLAVDIRAEPNYQVGSRDITDLWHFIEAQSKTVGHIDGEGHCHTE
jgi:hypothetical protein